MKVAVCAAVGNLPAVILSRTKVALEWRTSISPGGAGIHVILDMVGGDYVERNWKVAAVEGRICQIATLNGTSQEVNFSRLMVKRLTHTGSTLRPRDEGFKAAIATKLRERVWPLIARKKVGPVMDSTYPLDEAVAAHTRMEGSSHVGKIVLVTPAGA